MNRGLGSLLAHAVARAPERDAFRCRNEALTYGALDKRSTDLAATLVGLGVANGDRIAIAMTKGLEMPVAIHGIWKAGAVFVPLDPSAPADRLAGILERCDISVVIGAERDSALITALAERRTFTAVGVAVDGVNCVAVSEAAADFATRETGPEDMAYIMFTSGSTGEPKGMVHTHGSGMAFAEMWARLYDLQPDDVLFCTVPLHFDFCLADFLAIPIAGACTELVPEVVQRFPASLAAELERSRATIWSTVPYALTALRERGGADKRDLSALRWVIFGGEAISPRHLAAVRDVIGAEFSNSYGPAEVNQVTEYTVPRDHPVDQPVPIGTPTDHATLVRDEDGELLVASPSMMRGYWGQPELDAQVFVERDGQRFYRTGDMVEIGADELWQFGGRADRQIKVRGYRVELDEVEMAICDHVSVSEAAVVLAGDGMSLIAHVIAAPGTVPTAQELSAHAAERLARYAVPARFEIRETFPRTGTGKINRRVLMEEAR